MSKLDFTIHDTRVVTVKNGNISRDISLADFMSGLAALVGDEVAEVPGLDLILPPCLHSMRIQTSGAIDLHMYYPERKADLRCGDNHYRSVPIPNVMLKLTLQPTLTGDNGYALRNLRWMMTDREAVSLNDNSDWRVGASHVYPLAMPNCYSDGNMCYGGNSLPNIVYKDFSILNTLYHDVFLRSNFNNDLSVPGVSREYRLGTEWLSHIAGQDSFPYGECQ